jgi:hypothetical protein
MEDSAEYLKSNVIDPLLSILFLYNQENIEKMIQNPKVFQIYFLQKKDLTKGNLELSTFQQTLFENYMKMIEKSNSQVSNFTQEKDGEISNYSFQQDFSHTLIQPQIEVIESLDFNQEVLSLNSSGSSEYVETENEKKRKREIELEIEAKKLKKDKKNKKKKLF